MIKKKIHINNDVALKKACEDNDIILTSKGSDLKPVSYIDLEGKERKLDDKFSANNITKSIESKCSKGITGFNVGDFVRVYSKIKRRVGERVSVFEGMVVKRRGIGANETFTVRNFSNDGGIEKTWFIHSPRVQKIEVIPSGKVQRSKRNYLTKRVNKKLKRREG